MMNKRVYVVMGRVIVDNEEATGFDESCPEWMEKQFGERLQHLVETWNAFERVDASEKPAAYAKAQREEDLLVGDMHSTYRRNR